MVCFLNNRTKIFVDNLWKYEIFLLKVCFIQRRWRVKIKDFNNKLLDLKNKYDGFILRCIQDGKFSRKNQFILEKFNGDSEEFKYYLHHITK